MRNTQTWTKLLAVLVTLTMLFSLTSVFAAADEAPALRLPKTIQSGTRPISERKTPERGFKSEVFKAMNSYRYDADQLVTAIVVTSGDPAIDCGKFASAAAKMRRNDLKAAHETICAALAQKGIEYSFLYDYTSLMNGFSVQMKYGDLEDASAIPGVETIYIANEYTLPDESVNTAFANEMTASAYLNECGYAGQGILVAVLDTGTNTTHEAFRDYGLTAGITEEDVAGWLADGIVENGAYLSAKIPFAFDYANGDNDVTDTTSGHGTHVAGIAVGYAEDEEGNVIFSGAAPAAQLIAMKVFTDGSGSTNSAIYIKALEDCYAIGVDILNMSLGSACGFTYDPVLENELINNIYTRLDDAGIIATMSAGNDNSQALGSLNYYAQYLAQAYTEYADAVLPTFYTDYGKIGSPAAYAGNLSVAACENDSFFTTGIVVGDKAFYMSDSSLDKVPGMGFADHFAGQTLDYVLIPNFGEPADYEGLDVEGKVAIVNRGSTSFQDKLYAAAEAGAVAMICVNNQSGLVSMSIEDFPIPAISVPVAARAAFDADAVEGCGQLSVTAEPTFVITGLGGQMCDFSSWGVTSDLAFGPKITGVGGYVYSAYIEGDQSYEMMSGTSMAAPNVTGNLASVLSFINEAYPDLSGKARADFAEALIESTATVLDDGNAYYSTRKQGAGLVNAFAAAATGSYIVNPLHSLKDSLTGEFTFTIEVANLTDVDKLFYATPAVMSDTILGAIGGNAYMALAPSFLIEGEDYYVTSDLEDGILSVPAGETVEATFTITLDPYMMAYLDYYCPAGAFVDGYLFLDEYIEEGLDRIGDEIHASFFGYYGDWAEAPALDVVDSFDVADAMYFLNTPIDENGTTYADLGYGLLDVISDMNVGFNEAYLYCDNPYLRYYGLDLTYIGDNLFDYQPVNPAHAAISTPEYGWNHYVGTVDMFPAMLRNAAHIIMMAVDEETGEVYYIDDTSYVRKNLYDEETGEWSASTYFQFDGMDHSVEEPYYLANGSKVSIEYYVITDYQAGDDYLGQDEFATWEDYYAFVVNMAGDPDWALEVTIDSQLPELAAYMIDEETDSFLMGFMDNEYVAYFGLYDADGNQMGGLGFSNDVAGDMEVVGLPMSFLTPGTYYVDVVDYATNFIEYTMRVDEDGEIHVFDPETGYCLDCGLWSDGLYDGEFIYDPDFNVVDMYVTCPYFMLDALSTEPFVFPIADLAYTAAMMGAGMEFVLGDELMLTFDEAAAAQLAAQGDINLTVALSMSDNTVGLTLDLEGADFSDGICEVYYMHTETFNDDDVRVYYVAPDGSIELMDFVAWADMFNLVYWMTDHFSNFEIVFLDEYGHMIEAYVNEAFEYAWLASEIADEAADAARKAADAADEARAEADRAAAEALAAGESAEEAAARAEAAEAQAELAVAKAEAAQAAADAAKASADKAKASADAAKASAEKAAASADAAAASADEAAQYAADAKNALTSAEAAADRAEAAADAAEASADAAKASADKAKASATDAASAKKAAEAAKADAEAAKAAAEAAKSAAEAEKAAAEAAKADAEAAKADAEVAKADAESAKAAAEAEKAAAEAAKDGSLIAQTAAEAAQAAAETAKAEAEAKAAAADEAKAAAEQAKAAAETAQAAAASEKAAAESAKAAAEAAKAAAEEQKAAAEKAKADAEAAKAAAEAAKAAAEEQKAAAEQAKADAEAAKAAAEAAKAAAEEQKAAAEAAKAAAEEAKAAAEAEKAAAEAAKAAAEAAKTAAEAAKTDVDASKKGAEDAKADVDADKVAAEQAKNDAEAAKAEAEAAQAAAEAAQSAAESVLAEINAANEESGCGAVVGGAVVMILSALAAAVALKRKH